MIRTCDGTDPNLRAADLRSPCSCGQTFDDVRQMVIYPHKPVSGTVIITQGREHENGPLRPREIRYA